MTISVPYNPFPVCPLFPSLPPFESHIHLFSSNHSQKGEAGARGEKGETGRAGIKVGL